MKNSKGKEDPQFDVVAYDRDGAEIPQPSGGDILEMERQVRHAGGRLVAARLRPTRGQRPAGVSAEDFARFNELLASAVRRGIPMPDGLRGLAAMAHGGRFRSAVARVEAKLRQGAALREAFAVESSGFPELYGSMMEAGAVSGRLSDVLVTLSRNIRTDAEFRREVIEACVYPLLLVVACCALLIGFAAGILPSFENVAPQLSMRMPWLTRLLSTSNLTVQILATTAVCLGAALAFLVLRTEPVLRRLPLLGSLYEAVVWANASDTLALLVGAAIPAPTALQLVGAAGGSPWLRAALERLAAAAAEGRPLSTAAREDPDVPARFAYGLDMSERRGDLQSALSDVAARYRYDSQQRARRLVRILPPLFALVFGVVVFLLAMAVLGPYFRFWGAPW